MNRISTFLLMASHLFVLNSTNAIGGVLISPTSYSMPNGGGVASGGGLNYWDLNYSGAGSTNVDGAALSGGLGDLTDGVIADFWYNTENGAGTGPYVGWFQTGPNQLNPIITFNFTGNPTIDQVIIHLDNSSSAGVYAPENILINGNSFGYVAPVGAGLYAIDFSSLSLTGNQHTIQFFQSANNWVFVSEIQFFGATTPATVPEPTSFSVLMLGLSAVVLRYRNRKTASVSGLVPADQGKSIPQ